jgi:hypothetical protein
MQQGRTQHHNPTTHRPSTEWTKLIRKLRWIGLDDDAHNLELAVSTLPPEQRASVSAEPYGTD